MDDNDVDLKRLLSWDATLDRVSYYDLLGVVDAADDAAIRRAFHDFCLAFHPDGHTHRDATTTAIAVRVYRRGVEAYRVLCRPELRACYDRGLSEGRLRLDESQPRPLPADLLGELPLARLCRSPAARQAGERADHCLASGDLPGARREIAEALRLDGNVNPRLAERRAVVEAALSRREPVPVETPNATEPRTGR